MLYKADTPSCAPADSADKTALVDADRDVCTSCYFSFISQHKLPVRLKMRTLLSFELTKFCKQGWPSRHDLSGELCCYYIVKNHLFIADNLLLYDNRSTQDERRDTCAGHQGIQQYKLRLATSVCWHGVSKEIEKFMKSCPVYMKSTTSHTEPLLQMALPSHL